MPSEWRGGCLCGAVRYSIQTPIAAKRVTHCYCGQCRRAHGAAYATYGVVARKGFQLQDERGALRSFASSDEVTRSFCGECGSPLFWSHSQHPGMIDIAIGTLDDEAAAQVEVAANIFAASRAAWVALDERFPSFERFTDSAVLDAGGEHES